MSTRKRYKYWLNFNYPKLSDRKNRCNEIVHFMTRQFRELTVQVGYANGVMHCWCKDENGKIVDPTRSQFKKPIKYNLIAERFLEKDEIELSTGALFLREYDDNKEEFNEENFT